MSIFGFSCHGSEEIVVASVVIFPTAMSLLFPYYPCLLDQVCYGVRCGV